MVTAGADTETTPLTQIVYDPIYDHKGGGVASCIVLSTIKEIAHRSVNA